MLCLNGLQKKLMFAVRLPERGLEWYSRSFADAQDDKSGCAQDDKSGCVQETEGMKTETEAGESVSVSMSGYCDSNTGPSGPKPDALANCATPRIFTFSDTFQ